MYQSFATRPGTRQDPALVLILSLVTCGIYYLVWMHRVSQEVQDALGETDTNPGLEVLLTIVTCFIYSYFWDWKMAQKIVRLQENVGIRPVDNGVLYLILNFAGIGVVNTLMQQQQLNDVWRNWDRSSH
jgi:heme/copper-type cytochrome/quinol oxidase subunit 2